MIERKKTPLPPCLFLFARLSPPPPLLLRADHTVLTMTPSSVTVPWGHGGHRHYQCRRGWARHWLSIFYASASGLGCGTSSLQCLRVPSPGRPRASGDGAAWMMCRTGAAGDPSVAAVPVGAQSGGAMARAPSGRTDHRAAAGGVRNVTCSHKTVAAAIGCDSCTGAGTAAEAAKVTDNTAAGTACSTTDNGVRVADTAAAGMAECTTAVRAGSTGTPDTAHLGHGEAAGGTRPVHGILGGAGRSIFMRDVIHRLLTTRKHVVHLIGRAEPMDRRSGAGCMWGGSTTGALALQDDPRQLDVGTGEEVEPPRHHRVRPAAHPPPAPGRALPRPPDIRALHPRPPSAGGGIVR
ncbi:hypothetical protein PIB30_069019 [Stylosanthes scabra]|uniref:Uncharacterized protein n=1 Tax=Stylosanthes scabra TaxID=79078 RepID=A0ABU6ZLU0_9FABA|nr:hypothetical protein [Stylosanthes scabra]